MVKSTTIRLILSLTITHGWKLHQIDIQNIFLHRSLFDTIFMQQPIGFVDHKRSHFVCKLKKVIYSLKQAHRAWFSILSSWLTTYGLSTSIADPSLLIMHTTSHCVFILIYIDDMIITSFSSSVVDHLITSFNQSFPVKNLGQLSFFLGVELTYLSDGIFISQRKYISNLLKKTRVSSANPTSTSPMAVSTQLSKFDYPSFDNLTSF